MQINIKNHNLKKLIKLNSVHLSLNFEKVIANHPLKDEFAQKFVFMHNDGVTCVLLNLTNDKGQHVSQG